MATLSRAALLTVLLAAPSVLGHGHVTNIVVNGIAYLGYDPTSYPYMTDPPVVIGWTAGDTDNGFVAPDAYQNADIICHKSATPGGGHATVAAGDYISIQWSTWPDSHHGPVIDYLANCNGECETVDKTTLEFFKIDGLGWVEGGNPGTWGDDILIANNFTWLVQIPSNIAPGNYVLRHELIALHGASSVDGAQNYPQCLNLAITGSGTYAPSGTLGTALYQETDPGIVYNLYTSPLASYTMPGPTLISGASSSCPQSSSVATVTSSPTIPGSSGTTVVATTTASASTTAQTTSTVKSTTSTAVGSTSKSSTVATVTTSAAAGATGTQSKYGQCGGSGYTGPTSCVSGSSCTSLNAYYYQCV